MFDHAVLLILLALAVMVIQQVLGNLLGLRGRNLRSALMHLVRGVKVPTGFREDILVDRVLADPRIDPMSSGTKAAGAVTNVTRVSSSEFVTVLRDVLGKATPDTLVEGFAKRPESVRLELVKEIGGLGNLMVEHSGKHYRKTMAIFADRYKSTQRTLSVAIGAPLAGLLGYFATEGMSDFLRVSMIAIGVLVVPVMAAIWYGLIKNVVKLRPEAECVPTAPMASGGGNGRPARQGGGGRGGPSAPARDAGPSDRPSSSSGGSAASSRKRSRRSSGRRGGSRRPGGGAGDGPKPEGPKGD